MAIAGAAICQPPSNRRNDPSILPQAAECELFLAPRDGVIAQVEPKAIGRGITELGGQRTKVEDGVDHSVGFVITARPGDIVRAGEPLATVFAKDRAGVDAGLAALRMGGKGGQQD